MLANGMGGLDWSGLPYVIEFFGIQNVEEFLESVMVIKKHSAQVTHKTEE